MGKEEELVDEAANGMELEESELLATLLEHAQASAVALVHPWVLSARRCVQWFDPQSHHSRAQCITRRICL